MKVAVIADVLGEENNGTTTACMNLVRYLKSQGDEVTIVCCDQDKKGQEGYAVVGTYNLGPLINYMVARNGVALARPDKKIIEPVIANADVVHIMMPFALGKKAVKIANKLNKPVTAGFHVQAENFTTHIGLMNFGLANDITYHNFYHKLYNKVDGIHYPTQFIRDVFEKKVHRKTNGYVISNGVHDRFVRKSVEKPAELKDKYVILSTGRYSTEKSHKVLIKAVARSKYKKNIQLIFAGQGPYHDSYLRWAAHRGVNKPILRFFPKDELVNVINYSDLYCHPAEIEIEAIACLEAISCGLVPVISNSKRCATKAFAIDIHNLFKCNSATDLAKKIDYWIENPDEKERRSTDYLGFAKKFNQTACMEAMRNMMLECIEKHQKENKQN